MPGSGESLSRGIRAAVASFPPEAAVGFRSRDCAAPGTHPGSAWQEPLWAGAWGWERRGSAQTSAIWESISETSTWLRLTVRPALLSCRVAPGQARGHGGRGSLQLSEAASGLGLGCPSNAGSCGVVKGESWDG